MGEQFLTRAFVFPVHGTRIKFFGKKVNVIFMLVIVLRRGLSISYLFPVLVLSNSFFSFLSFVSGRGEGGDQFQT